VAHLLSISSPKTDHAVAAQNQFAGMTGADMQGFLLRQRRGDVAASLPRNCAISASSSRSAGSA
jgi:hypothetical protein